MKRRVWLVVVFMLALVATPALAQTNVVCPAKTVAYDIQKGDTLIGVYGLGWQDLKKDNPWIEGRTQRLDKFYFKVLIRPGEILCLPDGKAPTGWMLRSPSESDLYTGRTLLSTRPKLESDMSAATLGGPEPTIKTVEKVPEWMWWVFALLLIVASLACYYTVNDWRRRRRDLIEEEQRRDRASRMADEVRGRERREEREREQSEARKREELERELAMDPITSGTPFVPGGISADEPERIADFFTRQAAAEYMEREGVLGDASTIRVEQVGSIVKGTIGGEGEVQYNPGRFINVWRPRRIDPAIAAYQGRFRFPDGTEVVLQTLAGCMNPVRTGFGEVLRGFNFTPDADAVVVPAPEPNRVVVVTTGAADEPVTSVAQTNAKFISYAPAGANGPAMIRSHFIHFVRFDIEANGINVLRFVIPPTEGE